MDENIGHSCGLFGIFGSPNAAWLIYRGLFSLQHRGQESAGIAISDGKHIESRKGLGLVSDVFTPEALVPLKGHLGLGHVRYSTTGSPRIQNAQPLVERFSGGTIAVAHNGNLVNAKTLRDEYEAHGSIFHTSSDSEIIIHLLANPRNVARDNCWHHCLNAIHGAFSFLFLTKDSLIGARDPQGFRPLVLGRLGDAYVLASETCALDQTGAVFEREIAPGEMITIRENGVTSERFAEPDTCRSANCMFEHVYFARPDSLIFGDNVHSVRVRLGQRLAAEHPADADIVIGIPEGGIAAALGYCRESKIAMELGFIRNNYVGRTFIMPTPEARRQGVSVKLNVIREVVRGKRVVVVDDSIVRGTTTRGKMSQLRAAGAREIHLRISSPPIRWPCFYGIDFPTKRELIAANKTADEIAAFIEVDSLGYLSVPGMLSAVNGASGDYCTACWTGNYPVKIIDPTDKLSLEQDERPRQDEIPQEAVN